MNCEHITEPDMKNARDTAVKIENSKSYEEAYDILQSSVQNFERTTRCPEEEQLFINNFILDPVSKTPNKSGVPFALAVVWASRGDSSHTPNDVELNLDHAGVQESKLDAFIAATKPIGSLSYSMAHILKETAFPHGKPVGGINLGYLGHFGGDTVLTQTEMQKWLDSWRQNNSRTRG